MIYWAPLLHFYQPPTQSAGVLNRICDECYRPLLNVFHHANRAAASFNVNGSLTEQLEQNSATDILDGFRGLAEDGKIEFTGSAMYHPILPLIPGEERRRQIALNQRINRKLIGDVFKPIGFFPPELGFAPNIVQPVADTGHCWMLVSGVASVGSWPLDNVQRIADDDSDVAVLYRDDLISNRISFHELEPRSFLDNLRRLRGDRPDIYVVTAMDAETFGHHIPEWEDQFLGRVFDQIHWESAELDGPSPSSDDQIQVVKLSDLLTLFPAGERVMPRASSWSTSGDDLSAGNPFPLWSDPGNEVHRLQWEVTELCTELVRSAESLADNNTARHFARTARYELDRALHSCQYWWASRRPMWEVNMIHRGLLQFQEALLNAVLAIKSSGVSPRTRRDANYQFVAARALCSKIVDGLVA